MGGSQGEYPFPWWAKKLGSLSVTLISIRSFVPVFHLKGEVLRGEERRKERRREGGEKI